MISFRQVYNHSEPGNVCCVHETATFTKHGVKTQHKQRKDRGRAAGECLWWGPGEQDVIMNPAGVLGETEGWSLNCTISEMVKDPECLECC